jgi:hypothetical protein
MLTLLRNSYEILNRESGGLWGATGVFKFKSFLDHKNLQAWDDSRFEGKV